MTVTLAVALLALLVSGFTLAALVAVYARVRGLEAGTTAVGLAAYPTLVGRPAPVAARPGPGHRGAIVAVLDGDCALCRTVVAELATVPAGGGVRVVALTDRAPGPDLAHLVDGSAVAICTDPAVRADLFEGYAPTVLAVDAAGTVVARRFVYADSDVPELLRELARAASGTPEEVRR